MDKVIEVLRLTEAGHKQRDIAKSVKISRMTVRHYQTMAKFHRISVEDLVGFSTDEVKEILDIKPRGRKERARFEPARYIAELQGNSRLTRQILWEEYRTENPEGLAYSQFCDLLRQHQKSLGLSLRESHQPGEKVFVDWAGTKFPIYENGSEDPTYVSIFIGCLGYSNLLYFEACRNEKLEAWINCHVNMFEYFGGVSRIVVPDNTKTGVTSACYYEPTVNKTYNEFARHFGVAVLPTRPNKPRDKAKVESGVGFVTRQIVGHFRNIRFTSLSAFVVALRALMESVNSREMQEYKTSRYERFRTTEKKALGALPIQPFKVGLWHTGKVGVDYHVELEGHYYSVPDKYAGHYVELRFSQHTVEIFHESQRIAQHVRSHLRGHHTTLTEHMPANHRFVREWSPARFSEWAAKIGPETKELVEAVILSKEHPEQGYRAALGILSLGKKHGNTLLETAAFHANKNGHVSYRTTKEVVEMLLNDLEAPKQYQPVVHQNLRCKSEFK
jgi:transposase